MKKKKDTYTIEYTQGRTSLLYLVHVTNDSGADREPTRSTESLNESSYQQLRDSSRKGHYTRANAKQREREEICLSSTI